MKDFICLTNNEGRDIYIRIKDIGAIEETYDFTSNRRVTRIIVQGKELLIKESVPSIITELKEKENETK